MNIIRDSQNGFTIIEVMIFIAISGVIFMFGIGNMLNIQSRDQFLVSLNTLKNEIQTYLNNSANGNYQLPNGYNCVNAGTRLKIETNTPTNTSPDCSYLGSGLLFIQNNGTQLDQIDILPVFGYSFANGQGFGQNMPNSTSLQQSLPISNANLVNTYSIPGSIKISSVSYIDNQNNSTQKINMFLLLNNFNQYTLSSLNSGSQYSQILPILPNDINDSFAAATAINQLTDSCSENAPNQIAQYSCQIHNNNEVHGSAAPINPTGGISICLNNTNASESADLIIGDNNLSSNSTIYTKLYNRVDCN